MTEFKKLLVPVDFSAHSTEATRTASDLARRFDASITLVHVYDPLIYAFPDGMATAPDVNLERLFAALKTQLDATRQLALESGASRVDTRLLQGTVAGEIVELARRGEFDLIVMGTHGRTGMAHVIIGSIAERVLRLAPCPVLTVKRATSDSSVAAPR
jgi:universal stress protein A